MTNHGSLQNSDSSIRPKKTPSPSTVENQQQADNLNEFYSRFEMAVWCSLNNLELNTLKTMEMIVDFRRNPPCSPLIYHHEQHCDCSGVIQFSGHHHLPGPEVGQSRRLHFEKGPAEAVFSSPAEAVKPAIGTAEKVILPLSYQIWPRKTTESSPDFWANHWYNPPHSPKTVLIQSDQKGWQNHSGPLTSSTVPFWTVTVWSTLQSSEQQNGQTQEQFLPSTIMNTCQ